MATAAPSPSASSTGRNVNDQQMFGRLREIRAGAQYLQGFAADSLKQCQGLDAAARAGALREALPDALRDRLDQVISPQLDAIRQLFNLDPSQYEWCADAIATIRLNWARVKDLWPAVTATLEQIEQRLGWMDTALDQIAFYCASLTLSPRVNDALKNVRVGQVLDFDFEYADELPKNPELRKRLLLELAQESGVLDSGVVDADKRVIYKTAKSRREQIWSAWKLAFWIVGAAILVPAALAAVKGFSQDLLKILLRDYIFIFAGSGAHLAVQAVKSAKAQDRPSFQALNDWFLWVHVRYTQIFWGIAYVWLGYVLLIMTIGAGTLQWQSAFFAGYSIDSVVDLLLGRFEATVKGKVKALAPAAG